MDKYEKKVRVNQIISCIKNGEYQDAQEIADTIDWRQEKSVRTLRMVSEVYKINKRYEDALAVLNLAYEKDPEDPIKRKIVYDLCELAIKMGQFGIAVRYMKEFSKLAPKDPGRYILQYRLLKATDADYGERIELLEEFKSRHFGDFDGKWAYELAYLYHLTGKGEKCVECCNEIALWFVTGPVVVKALKLKREHEPLTYEEEQKVFGSDQGIPGEEILYQKKHDTNTAPVYMDTTPGIGDGYSTGDADYINNGYPNEAYPGQPYEQNPYQQDPYAGQPYEAAPASPELNIEVKKVDASFEPTIRMAEKKTGPSIMTRETNVLPDINKSMPVPEPAPQDVPEPVPAAEPAVQPETGEKTAAIPQPVPVPSASDAVSNTGTIAQQEISVNLDKFSTMNLQQELRENMEKLQAETGEPLREKEERLPDRVAEPDKELTELKAEKETHPLESSEPVRTTDPTAPQEPPAAVSAPDRTGSDSERSQSAEMSPEEIASKISRVPVPDRFKNMISQEMDGQMQLNVPAEEPADEKQITGQMDIESILAEWDKLQEEARDRRIKAAKQKSLDQTNDIVKPLAEALPGYEMPQVEESEIIEPVKAAPEKAELEIEREMEQENKSAVSSSFTGALVVSESITAGVDVNDIEAALEAGADASVKEAENDYAGEKNNPPYDYETGEEAASQEENSGSPADEKEKSPEPARKKPHFVTYDTVELPSVFDSFLNIKGLAPQLKEAEDRMSMEASHGNVLIIGSEHAARMELIQAIVRDMSEREAKGEIKAAAIDADTFNNKDVDKSLRALSGNVLVIEGAGRLSDDAMNALLSSLSEASSGSDAGEGQTDEAGLHILVILEDSKGGAKNLNEYNGFNDVFDVLVDIPTLSNDYLVDHAKSYALEKYYTLDDMAILALYQRIDERQTADHVVTSDEVEHIIDAAIKKANKKNLKHLGDVLFGKRYNDEDLIVLREKDFAK